MKKYTCSHRRRFKKNTTSRTLDIAKKLIGNKRRITKEQCKLRERRDLFGRPGVGGVLVQR